MLRRVCIFAPRQILHRNLVSLPFRRRQLPQAHIMPRRKQTSAATAAAAAAVEQASATEAPQPPPVNALKRRRSARQPVPRITGATNPDVNDEVLDGPQALRASPDSTSDSSEFAPQHESVRHESTPLSEVPDEVDVDDLEPPPKKKQARKKKTEANGSAKAAAAVKKNGTTVKKEETVSTSALDDPEAAAEDDDAPDADELKLAISRPPPVNSSYLPLPWKGRLGYACLNTYLRYSNPPVFCSRTTRIASILEHRHPLKDPSQPHHPVKNRPDTDQPADEARGMAFVQDLALANVRDMCKLIRWNDKYGIRFLRLSSEAFPFASHPDYGYDLDFAADALAEVGALAAKLGHRLTCHPGQFNNLTSPNNKVIEATIRDLGYHEQMLSLLKLPPQQDRDAIMIIHMGGVYGDKAASLDRFRENYPKLPAGIKKRLVLENDDVSWSVHDLLPVCQDLNIPMVLDFHHHNIIFNADELREGTLDIMELFPAILETWRRKDITPKMHYSEPTPAAVTGRQRRKHNPRVATLPPCPPDMDLMIEAKDKEQAVLELMRTFKLPGHERAADMVPHVRHDDNKLLDMPSRQRGGGKSKSKKKATPKKRKRSEEEEEEDAAEVEKQEEEDEEARLPARVPDDDVGMGGPQGRVYWPPTMEDWLRPVKRVVKKKGEKAAGAGAGGKSAAAGKGGGKKAKKGAAVKQEEDDDDDDGAEEEQDD